MSKKPFTHKDISFPDHVFFKNVSRDNYYLQNVADTFPRLYDIYEGKTSYIPQDFPVLVSMYEQLYKGVTKELQKIYPDIGYSDNVFVFGHHFAAFLKEINRYIPISRTKEGYHKIVNFTRDLEKEYTPSRFSDPKGFPEFRFAYRRFESALYRMQKGLEAEYDKLITEEEEKDLEDF